jgi:hypothetical protein
MAVIAFLAVNESHVALQRLLAEGLALTLSRARTPSWQMQAVGQKTWSDVEGEAESWTDDGMEPGTAAACRRGTCTAKSTAKS